MTTLTVLALLPWLQAQLLAAEIPWPKQMSCRIEAQMRAFSLQQHLIDGGSQVRPVPTVCAIRKKS